MSSITCPLYEQSGLGINVLSVIRTQGKVFITSELCALQMVEGGFDFKGPVLQGAGRRRIMERTFMTAALLLCSLLGTRAGLFELPIAATEAGVLDFWPRLNASCEIKPLEDDLCCLDSTFKDRSDAQDLLLKLLENLPYPKYDVRGDAAQLLHKSANGLDVGARYKCDIPLGQDGNDIPGLGCHRCLRAIALEISSGMLQNVGRCANAWAVRLGYIYEPDMPWEEDTTWCHLDYWFRILPSPLPSSRSWIVRFRDMLTRPTGFSEEDTTSTHLDYWITFLPSDPSTRFCSALFREMLTRTRSWLRWNSLTYIFR